MKVIRILGFALFTIIIASGCFGADVKKDKSTAFVETPKKDGEEVTMVQDVHGRCLLESSCPICAQHRRAWESQDSWHEHA